jgi:dynein heavy chain
MDNLNTIKREVTSRSVVVDQMHPYYAGSALWAKGLKRRIEHQMLILNMAHFLPSGGVGEEARVQFKQTLHALDEFMRKCQNEWTYTLENDPLKLLETPLLKKSSEAEGMIDVNLNCKLLKLIAEIYYWERLGFEIPPYCADAYGKKEELVSTRENVLTVVLDYNRIISSLSREERGMFKERIKALDKRIQPGFNKLTWTKPQAAEEFSTTCRRHASDLQAIVDKYKDSLMSCFRSCKKISEQLLVRIDPRKICENLEFEEDQMKHRKQTSVKLAEFYESIEHTLKSTHEIFKKDDSEEVKREWNKLIDKIYRMLEESLRLNVKNSLLELSKAINGDGKSIPNPLFKVQVMLESYEENLPAQYGMNDSPHSTIVTKFRVNFGPTLDQLAHLVNSIGQYHLTDTISNIIKSKYDVFPKNRSPIYLNISRDEDKLKIEQQIAAGMENNAKLLEQYLTTWNNFRELWEISKDMFLLRYEQRNPAVSTFDGDIARYTEVENNIQIQETIQTIQFVLLDCSSLKYSLLGHCQEWQNKFTALLLKLATQSLNRIMKYFEENSQKVLVPPDTHYDLDMSSKLLESLQNDLPRIEEQFLPLNDQFSVLQKYEVAVPEEVNMCYKL